MTSATDTPTIYDDVDWHLDDDFPDELDESAAGTHIAIFLAWVVINELESDSLAEDCADEIARLRDGEMSALEFLECCDGVLNSDDLSETANEFARDYYEEDYLDDYVELSDDELPTIYHEPDTPAKEEQVFAVLDRRFTEWQDDADEFEPDTDV